MAFHPTTHVRSADHRPSAPGHEVWGIFTRSRLSITGGNTTRHRAAFPHTAVLRFPVLW